MIISLIGFMGSGKSSVGKELQKLMECQFIDLDSYIEEKTGSKIPEIFASKGEAAFRDMETEALQSILKDKRSGYLILALGGGTLTNPESAKLVRKFSTSIYLKASIDTLIENLKGASSGRPMLKGADGNEELRKRVGELMAIREHEYLETADLIINIDNLNDSPASIAKEIHRTVFNIAR